MTRQDPEYQGLLRQLRREAAQAGETERVAEMKARAEIPAECGPMMRRGPANGAFRVFTPLAFYPDGEDGWTAKDAGYLGRKAIANADIFDRMFAQAARRKAKSAPLTQVQVAVARHYRDLTERHATAGLSCSSFEGRSGGGTDATAFMDALLSDRLRLDLLHVRIEGEREKEEHLAMSPTRASETRMTIRSRRLVESICIGDQSIDAVLKAHGWPVNARYYRQAMNAFRQILDRMSGSRFEGRILASTYGVPGAAAFWADHKAA
ncbi:hypothetical protein [Pseudooceanicola sp.]|uniref:hypothetical protein n=1 Tax=Pseudooceanicola sp. TaxID=1914328 RepID=UPI004059DA33